MADSSSGSSPDPSPGEEALGLIAGMGVFPLEVARSARRAGRRVVCVALRGRAEAALEHEVWQHHWIHPGEVMSVVTTLREAGVREAVMAGKVEKDALFQAPDSLRMDEHATEMLGQVRDRKDDTLLGKVADFLSGLGIELLPQYALTPDLLVGEGVLTKTHPSEAQRADIAFGLPIAKTLGDLDIGQTVVVKDGAVLALEAIEGTDAAIRRAAQYAEGACVVKVAKPSQDPRFDVPTVGPATIAVAVECKVSVLAFEAGATVVLERDRMVEMADAHGIAVLGVAPERRQ